jgi:hypothetical protein
MLAEGGGRQAHHARRRKPASDVVRIFARIPDLFSYRAKSKDRTAAGDRAVDAILIDATETPIERPKKRRYSSDKKKRHTLKTQLVVEKSTRRFSASRPKKGAGTTSGCSRGQRSGCCILKRKPLPAAAIKPCRACTPPRRCRRSAAKRIRWPQPARPETAPSSERVPCENVIAMLKRFKIIGDRDRNRRRRFGLRFFLIAAIYNMERKAHDGYARGLIPTLTHIRRDPTRCLPRCAVSKLKQTWCTQS